MDLIENELESIPEPEHVELVMDGIIDSIAGTESLTKAQHYLSATLYANGLATRKDVAGVEGFFSAIGNGIKAAIEYVKKMFQSIWGFFFGKKSEELTKRANDSLVRTEQKLEKVKEGVKPSNVRETLKKAEEVLKKNENLPGANKVKETVEAAKNEPDDKKAAEAAKDIPDEIFEMKMPDEEKLKALLEPYMKKSKELENKLFANKTEKTALNQSLDLTFIVTVMSNVHFEPHKLRDLDEAYDYVADCRVALVMISERLKPIRNREAAYKELIAKVERGEQPDIQQKALEDLKQSLSEITALITLVSDTLELVRKILDIVYSCII